MVTTNFYCYFEDTTKSKNPLKSENEFIHVKQSLNK